MLNLVTIVSIIISASYSSSLCCFDALICHSLADQEMDCCWFIACVTALRTVWESLHSTCVFMHFYIDAHKQP